MSTNFATIPPSMPVETYLTTSDRTVFSFLSKLMMDQPNQAFWEE